MAYIIAVLALLSIIVPGGHARAGALDPSNSFLELKVADIPPLRTRARSAGVTLTGGATFVAESPGVFAIEDYAIETGVFTGLPLLTGFEIDLEAGAAQYAAGASYTNPMGYGVVSGFGGMGLFSGAAILSFAGFDILFEAAPFGVGGTDLAIVLNNQIFVTGAPFNTGEVRITGITSPVVFAPSLGVTGVALTLNLTTAQLMTAIPLTNGGEPIETHAVNLRGAHSLDSVAGTGELKMISPIRIRTEFESRAAVLTKTLRFVPEPVVALQLLAGAAGLMALARWRAR